MLKSSQSRFTDKKAAIFLLSYKNETFCQFFNDKVVLCTKLIL